MAASYNELFGLGGYSVDSALQGWWKLQDSAENTTIEDSGPGNYDMVLTGAGNTSASSVAGPTAYLANGILFDGTNDYAVTSAGPTLALSSGTIVMWLRNTDSTPPSKGIAFGAGSAEFFMYGTNHSSQEEVAYNWNGATAQWQWVDGPAITRNTWTHCAVVVNSTAAKCYTNGVLGGTNSISHASIASKAYSGVTLGRFPGSNQQYLQCEQASTAWFSRDLTGDEIAQAYNGPEPINTVAPTVPASVTEGSQVTPGNGSWDSQSNGDPSYTYTWYTYTNQSGAGETQVGTASTYTPVSGDVGKYLRVKVRGSNSGGHAANQDTFSNYSNAIAAAGVTGNLAATESGSDTVAIAGDVIVTGTLAATESGADAVAIEGDVIVSGTLAATETGSDVVAIAGGVVVTGNFAATETGSDAVAITGTVVSGIVGNLAATEVGSDSVAISGAVAIVGNLAATESGSDAVAVAGQVIVSGTLAATETGTDVAAFAGTVSGAGPVTGNLAATESGSDVVSFAGRVLVSGTLAATEVGADIVAIYSTAPAVAGYPMVRANKIRQITAHKTRSLTAHKRGV